MEWCLIYFLHHVMSAGTTQLSINKNNNNNKKKINKKRVKEKQNKMMKTLLSGNADLVRLSVCLGVE